MKLHIAMITHEHGATGFADIDYANLQVKIANWCKNHEHSLRTSSSDESVIENYFDKHMDEYLFEDTVEV